VQWLVEQKQKGCPVERRRLRWEIHLSFYLSKLKSFSILHKYIFKSELLNFYDILYVNVYMHIYLFYSFPWYERGLIKGRRTKIGRGFVYQSPTTCLSQLV